MNRLTQRNEQGRWSLKGFSWDELHGGAVISPRLAEALYGALCKLKDYEDTGLSPEDVERINDFEQSQTGMLLKKLNEEQRKHRWIPVEEKLPEPGKTVGATVKHSDWISDYGSDYIPEEKQIYHPESCGVYKAQYIGSGIWKYADEENEWIHCDAVEKEERDPGTIYDTVIAWMPLLEAYRPDH